MSLRCDICGRKFKSRRGLGIHKGWKHPPKAVDSSIRVKVEIREGCNVEQYGFTFENADEALKKMCRFMAVRFPEAFERLFRI